MICSEFQIDAYKIDHRRQYPDGTGKVYSNLTARSDKLFNKIPQYWDGKAVFFGLQVFILEYLIDDWDTYFFHQDKEVVLDEYNQMISGIIGPDHDITVDHIESLHNLGYLPLSIKALPEGAPVDMKIPMFTITNTLPEFFWLVNYLETVMSSELWKPITTATIARQYRKIIDDYAEKTGCVGMGEDFQCHDFSFRGMSGRHDAGVSGMGHLLSFTGTDSIPAVINAQKFYEVPGEYFYAGSVPATEHSVMCIGGKETERETFKRLLHLYPKGIVSIVSDTWDFWKVLTEIAPSLKEEIMSRDENFAGLAKTVFRPDSGDPVDILCGTPILHLNYEYDFDDSSFLYNLDEFCHANKVSNSDHIYIQMGSRKYWADVLKCYSGSWSDEYSFEVVDFEEIEEFPVEVKGAVEVLWDEFGGSVNEEGYKVLDPHVGLIYGDSITLDRCHTILKKLEKKGFASCNVVFGLGSYTYQYITRDTLGMAVKATYGVVDGEGRAVQKDPATDNGIKKSACGLLRVEKEEGRYVLYDNQTEAEEALGELVEVFRDGELLVRHNFEEIRKRARS